MNPQCLFKVFEWMVVSLLREVKLWIHWVLTLKLWSVKQLFKRHANAAKCLSNLKIMNFIISIIYISTWYFSPMNYIANILDFLNLFWGQGLCSPSRPRNCGRPRTPASASNYRCVPPWPINNLGLQAVFSILQYINEW